MTASIRVDQDVPMTTRDGVTLRADVYRPDDDTPQPAVLIRTPYNKQRKEAGYITPMQLARAGYACVVQDTRGRFASEGTYVSLGPEGEDGYDAVEWVAAQPWCDGNVGMTGGSYVGRTQWEAAEQAPPLAQGDLPRHRPDRPDRRLRALRRGAFRGSHELVPRHGARDH